MSNLLHPKSPYTAQAAAEKFVERAANGDIGDELVEDLRHRKFSQPLIELATSAEMTPWVFLDYVADQLSSDVFNEIMLGSISPELFGLLTMLNKRDDEVKKATAIAELSHDLELALTSA